MDASTSESAKRTARFCSYCGTKLDEGARFCKSCGESVGQVQQGVNNAHSPESPKTEITQPNSESVMAGPRTKRTTVYDGEIHKCPNCGEVLKSFATTCSACGYELRSVKTNSPVEELAKKIETAADVDEKIELITNFYIPNTKEDIFDFFILAVSNLDNNRFDTDDAWRAKLEQSYHKARLSFGSTPEFEYLEKLYNRTRKEMSKRERGLSAVFRRNKITCITVLLIGGGILMLVIGIILLSVTWAAENFGTSWGGLMFAILGINFIISPTWVLDKMKKEETAKKEKKDTSQKSNSTILPIGKDAEDFLNQNCDDIAEFLRSIGFGNVVLKAEKKGLLDTEGAVKGISVAGNAEFGEYDEFDVNSKIIIRYYSRKY